MVSVITTFPLLHKIRTATCGSPHPGQIDTTETFPAISFRKPQMHYPMTVSCLEWMDKNKLAVYRSRHAHHERATGETHDLIVPSEQSKFLYKFNAIMSALSDKHGNVVLLTRSGFYHYDSLSRLVFRFDYYRRDEIPTEYFAFGKKVFWLSNNEVLVHSIDGAYIYDIYERRIKKITMADPLLSDLAAPNHFDFGSPTSPVALLAARLALTALPASTI